jgi:hypothetical protein
MSDIEVTALDDAMPQAKATWVSRRIERASLEMVEFFDDSRKNVAAIDALANKYPQTQIVTRLIVHNRVRSLLSK